MITVRTTTLPQASKAASALLCTPFLHPSTLPLAPKASVIVTLHSAGSSRQRRAFHSTPAPALQPKQWFPPPETHKIRNSPPAWHHPEYAESQMTAISVEHKAPQTFTDRIAHTLMRLARFGLDTATGYTEKRRPGAQAMDERKWLVRIVFLESIAGVPGMVAGMLRHLHSLRRLKRDNGWIETLLEEAYNERMHLLTFLKIAEPGWFMKIMILGAQGVFFNGFFLAYLMSPRACHRFVGYLEEEAVHTYSYIIREIEAGNLPMWSNPKFQIPDIAVQYWNMPENKRTMYDLMLYVRADEAKHREVNHTLGNLDQKNDPNPFISNYKDPKKEPHPDKTLEHIRPLGWERKEVI